MGEWLPSDQAVLQKWLQNYVKEVDSMADSSDDSYSLRPVVQKFKDEIENNPEITMFFHQMFSEIPKRYKKTPTHKPQVRNYHHMLRLINHILTKAPEFNETGLVGFPINAILDWPMGTIGEYAAFVNPKVNLHLKSILNQWGAF